MTHEQAQAALRIDHIAAGGMVHRIAVGLRARDLLEEHLELFHRYAPDLRIDYFLVDPSVVRNRTSLESLARQYGGELVIGDIRKAPGSVHHDEKKLASQLSHIFNQSLLG